MKLSLYLAATLVLSISSAAARPAQVAANHPKLATASIAADVLSSLPKSEATQSAGLFSVPDPDLSEDVLSHPPSIPVANSPFLGDVEMGKTESTGSIVKTAATSIPINEATAEQQIVSVPAPVSVLPQPTPNAANLKVDEALSADVEKAIAPMASSVPPLILGLQTSSAAHLSDTSSMLKNASPTDMPSIAVFDPESAPSDAVDINGAPSATYSVQKPYDNRIFKAGDVFDPESVAHTVNVLEGYPIVSANSDAVMPTTPPMKVNTPTKVVLSVPVVSSSPPSMIVDDFENAEADLMGAEVGTTAFAAVLPTSSVSDVLNSVPEPSEKVSNRVIHDHPRQNSPNSYPIKVLATNINLPGKPIPAESISQANPPKEPLAKENEEKLENAIPLPIPLSSVDLPFAPPKPTIISVEPLPSLALPTPPLSIASAVLPHFAESVLPVQDKFVELAQAMGRASGALADVKEAVDRYIKEHMLDGKMIDMHNVKQQNKQPNLVHAFIDFQRILEACKVLINSVPGNEAITNADLQRLIQEAHDLMIRARQMEIEYFESMAGMNANLQQSAKSLLEQSDIEKALANDNNQEAMVPQLNPDELAKLVSQFVEEMQKFLIDFAKSFAEINPAVPTPSIQLIPEPTLPSLSIIPALSPVPVSVPISIPVQEAVQSAAPTIPTILPNPAENVPAHPEHVSSPAEILPANPTLPTPSLPTQPVVAFASMLSDESAFTDLDFVGFLGTGTTYAAVPTTLA
ncbi:hypothetical protein INT43_004347 [Umbelopsis isabellina]|uniref:Uncharacterized protein n=1 Tax=Mortierella isabellina TaxID=91625 RepID=A0A8H7UCB5_MORIS|nr:hypothetical protein INT43_004347 [Umbelopsis isabellina]